MEGADGEIQRSRETVGRLVRARQARGHPCPGWLKAAGKVDAKFYGLAVLPQYREVKPTECFAPLILPLLGSSLAKAGAAS